MLTSTQPDFTVSEIHIVLTQPYTIVRGSPSHTYRIYCRITYVLLQRSIAVCDTKTVSLNVRYEILWADALKNTVIWIVMPSSLAEI